MTSPDPRHIMTQGCGRKRESHSSETELSELGAGGGELDVPGPQGGAGPGVLVRLVWSRARRPPESSAHCPPHLYFWFPQVLEPLPRQGRW